MEVALFHRVWLPDDKGRHSRFRVRTYNTERCSSAQVLNKIVFFMLAHTQTNMVRV